MQLQKKITTPGVEVSHKKFYKNFLINNNVTIIFIALAIGGIFLSELSLNYIVSELINRISRNSFLVLSLIIPIIAGVGLNFGIVVGAMAGQIAIITITYLGLASGVGFFTAIAISTPIAILFGYLTGQLYNRTKGQEMISGLILGFFANGIYQFIFLFLAGTLIPMKDHVMIKPDGVGLRNTIALNQSADGGKGILYAIDGIWKVRLSHVLLVAFILLVLTAFLYILLTKNKGSHVKKVRLIGLTSFIALLIVAYATFFDKGMASLIMKLKIPVITWCTIGLLCIFTILIMKTKLGQDFRTIGQSQQIGKVAGINVNKTRLIAVIISTVLAAWGQIVFLQNIGTMNTYGSHMQVGMFSVAAILIGGASVSKATVKHALLGILLFQSVFIVSPTAGKTLFDDAQIGEFFRAFVVYGVIGISLGLHAWRVRKLKAVQKNN